MWGTSGGGGRRRSTRIPVLSTRLRDTDAEERQSQGGGGVEVVEEGDGHVEEEEEQLRAGAARVIHHLQVAEVEVGEDEPPGLLGSEMVERGDEEEVPNGASAQLAAERRQGAEPPVVLHRPLVIVEEEGEGEDPPGLIPGDDDDEDVEDDIPLVQLAGGDLAVQQDQGVDAGGNAQQLEGERGDLALRVSPVVPPPQLQPGREVAGDTEGWSSIYRLGGWKCLISQFRAMDFVPSQYHAIWGGAWSTVLRRIQEAEGEEDLDRALLWLLFFPQALCRKPQGGGVADMADPQVLQPAADDRQAPPEVEANAGCLLLHHLA